MVYHVDDGTAWIRLNRPEVLNAFDAELYGTLKRAIRSAQIDNDVDTIVLTGTGRGFSAGGDLKAIRRSLEDADPQAIFAFDDNSPLEVYSNCEKTVIAAVNGVAAGSGLAFALAADICVASESASFGNALGRWGMGEPLSPQLLFGRVSLARIKYMLFTGNFITAVEAERIGMIAEVVPDDKLYERTREIVGEVRQTSAEARALFKRYVNALNPLPLESDVMNAVHAWPGRERLASFGRSEGEE